jgi:hypothetical protein
MIPLATFEGTVLRYEPLSRVLIWCGKMDIDADGSPNAYTPQDTGLDALRNAKDKEGNWCGIAVDSSTGHPYRQEEDGVGPATGNFISTTALQNSQFPINDTRRYVDSETIPFIVLPGHCPHAPCLGAKALVVNLRNGKHAEAIYADIGPRNSIGEGSIALARLLGINDDARTGGQSSDVLYIVYPTPV